MNTPTGERDLKALEGKELLAEWLRQIFPTCTAHATLIEDLIQRMMKPEYAEGAIPKDLRWGEGEGDEEAQKFEAFIDGFNPPELGVYKGCKGCQQQFDINVQRDAGRLEMASRGRQPNAKELKVAMILDGTRAPADGQHHLGEQRMQNNQAILAISQLSGPGDVITD